MDLVVKSFYISFILSPILGALIAFSYLPLETNIVVEPNMTKTVKESFSSQIISYSTTGTTLSSFVNCESGFDPYSLHQCLILSTDGKPGIIEVAVPKTIIKDISDASASGFWGESLKFQRGYSGVSYNYIKVEVPANQGVIINGYSWDHGPVSTFLFASFLLWVLAWLATVFVVSLIERGISKIRSS